MTHGPGSRLTGLTTAAVLALGLACEQPPALPTQDRRSQVKTSHIQGEVVVTGPARGNVIITRFDASRPPPPLGTGRPLSFTIVPESQLFPDGDGSQGPFTAPYAFSQVGPGKYLLAGFLDSRGAFCPGGACRASDFIPWYGVTGEPNLGDFRGGALNLANLQLRELEIASQNEEGDLNALTGVTFSVDSRSSATQVPVDRPVFRLNTATTPSPVFQVSSTPLCPGSSQVRCKFLDLLSEPVFEGAIDQRAPTFVVRFVDDRNNATGALGPDCIPDDANRDGQPDFWPKIIIRKLAAELNPALLTDENDYDRDGLVDAAVPEGASLKEYRHADGTLDGTPDIVVLAAGVVPDSAVLAQLVDAGGAPRVNCGNPSAPVWPVATTNQLRLVIQSVGLDVINPAAPVVLQSPPAGRYAIVVMNPTGQTWRTPNELQPGVAGAAGLPERATQALFLDVQ